MVQSISSFNKNMLVAVGEAVIRGYKAKLNDDIADYAVLRSSGLSNYEWK